MHAAKALFLKQGYAATSLEQVVAAAGGSLATIYQLFGNKEGLWRALVGAFCEQISAPLVDPAAHDGGIREALIAVGLNLSTLDASPDAGGGIRMILAEGGRYPELAKGLFDAGPDAGRKMLANYLAEEVAAARLAIDDPSDAAEQFCNLAGGDRLLRNACGALKKTAEKDERRRIERAVDMFLRAYAVTPSEAR
jgi:AcrR family transcriptional regulator